MNRQSVPSQPVTDPLALVALETERHVAGLGWDQPPRLFALVSTAQVVAREPGIRERLSPADLLPGALMAIEQDEFGAAGDLESLLASIGWPSEVAGCALAVERLVVPPEAERDLPEQPDEALARLLAHPGRRDVRLLVATMRDGRSICLLRQRAHDRDEDVAMGEDIAPGLVAALAATLR